MVAAQTDVEPCTGEAEQMLAEYETEMARHEKLRPESSWQYADCMCPGALPVGAALREEMRHWPVIRLGNWIFPLNPQCPHLAKHVEETRAA